MESEISALNSIKVDLIERQCIYVRFTLYLTVIDGKVLNALTNTKS